MIRRPAAILLTLWGQEAISCVLCLTFQPAFLLCDYDVCTLHTHTPDINAAVTPAHGGEPLLTRKPECIGQSEHQIILSELDRA